ncbi:MAG: CHASE2 domain-containing protein [Myxococcota bacterium]
MQKVFRWLKRITPLRIALAIALVFCITHVLIEGGNINSGPLSKRGLIHLLDLKALDTKIRNVPTDNLPPPQVVIAAIDEKSVERFGLWPWNRTVIADFINAATQGGAKVVGFDATFSDEDRNASYQDVKRFLDAYNGQGLGPKSEQFEALNAQISKLERHHDDLEEPLPNSRNKQEQPRPRYSATSNKAVQDARESLKKAKENCAAPRQTW